TIMGSDSDAAEDWYLGVLDEIVNQLELESDLDVFWEEHSRLSPVHRWSRFLRQVLLEEVAEPIVLFIDEIDSVLVLPFSTDDFFASIRATYNQRAGDSAFERLTFCLLGVAAPSDLMKDPQRTPFNIGRPIPLNDFNPSEAGTLLLALAELSREPEALLTAVLAWSDGHPYMTQVILKRLSDEDGEPRAPDERVREVVAEFFFKPGTALEINLQTAQDRLLRAGAAAPGMLALYRRVLAGGDVPVDERDAVQQALQLTGLVASRVVGGRALLRVRNRIFAETFDMEWVEVQEGRRPFSEVLATWLRNHRADDFVLRGRALEEAQAWARTRDDLTPEESAFLLQGAVVEEKERRRAMRRAWAMVAVLATGVVVAMLFGLYAIEQKNNAYEQRQRAENARREAEEAEELAVEQRESADLQRRRADEQRDLAEEKSRLAEAERVRAETEQTRAEVLAQEALRQKAAADEVRVEAVAAADEAQEARKAAEAEKQRAEESEAEAKRLRLLSAARALAIQSTRMQQDEERELAALLALQAFRLHVASGGAPGNPDVFHALWVTLGRLAPEAERVFRDHRDAVRAVAFGPDGRTVASGSDDGRVRLFARDRPDAEPQVLPDRAIALGEIAGRIRSIAFDAAGERLAAGSFDGSIRVWELGRDGSSPRRLTGHGASVNSLAFQQGGPLLASASSDDMVGLWDLERPEAPTLLDASHPVTAVAWSIDGHTLAAGTAGGGVLLWNVDERAQPPGVLGDGEDVRGVGFSPDGRFLAGATRRGVVLLWTWNGHSGSQADVLEGHSAEVTALDFAVSRALLASASRDGSVRLWGLERLRLRGLERLEAEPIVFADHRSWVLAVALSADGEWVASGGRDRTVRLRRTRAEPLAEEICTRVSRNLTANEWSELMPADVAYEETCPNLAAEGEGEGR
ncbi:MAG: hypothetical protein GY856_38300, partial [bacterium]|nr:hypothetical protein [bacterium]